MHNEGNAIDSSQVLFYWSWQQLHVSAM